MEYWTLKQKQLAPRLTKEIKGQNNADNPTLKKCNLYLNEKLAIIDDSDKNLLNKRSKATPNDATETVLSWCTSRDVKQQITLYDKRYPSIVLFRYGMVYILVGWRLQRELHETYLQPTTLVS